MFTHVSTKTTTTTTTTTTKLLLGPLSRARGQKEENHLWQWSKWTNNQLCQRMAGKKNPDKVANFPDKWQKWKLACRKCELNQTMIINANYFLSKLPRYFRLNKNEQKKSWFTEKNLKTTDDKREWIRFLKKKIVFLTFSTKKG